MPNIQPKVYITGAGPGSRELLTLRAAQVLREADIIYYDNLIDKQILGIAPPGTIKIPVGKSGFIGTVSQGEINKILVQQALTSPDKTIIRLKGGDPFVFGRGAEEAAALSEAGIPYEIIPGVSSATSAPLYAGIPLTCRDVSLGFTVVTGHDRDDDIENTLNWASLAGIGHTLVFLMCLQNLGRISSNLIQNGKPPDTPAALISSGSTLNQKVYTTTLSDIDAIPDEYRVSPAILIVGDVVKLQGSLNWYNPMPRHNILMLRDIDGENDHLATRMNRASLNVDYLPTLSISKSGNNRELSEIIKKNNIDWLIINSGNALRYLAEGLKEIGLDMRVFYNTKIAVVGKSTQEALSKYGLNADFIPTHKFTGKDMALELREKYNLKGASLLIPSGNLANSIQQEIFEAAGAHVYKPVVYLNEPMPLNPDSKIILQRVSQGYYDGIGFLSPSGGMFLNGYLAELGLELPGTVTLFAIGETTKAGLSEIWPAHGIMIPGSYTLERLCDTIIEYFTNNDNGNND